MGLDGSGKKLGGKSGKIHPRKRNLDFSRESTQTLEQTCCIGGYVYCAAALLGMSRVGPYIYLLAAALLGMPRVGPYKYLLAAALLGMSRVDPCWVYIFCFRPVRLKANTVQKKHTENNKHTKYTENDKQIKNTENNKRIKTQTGKRHNKKTKLA
jgi:hypothetical protein